MPRAIELMRRREEELSKAVLYLSEKRPTASLNLGLYS